MYSKLIKGKIIKQKTPKDYIIKIKTLKGNFIYLAK